MSCSTSSTVSAPSDSRSRKSATVLKVSSTDSPCVGSSRSSSSGCCTSAIATSSSRWSPCESRPAGTSATWPSPTRSSQRDAARAVVVRASPMGNGRQRCGLLPCAASRTFSRADSRAKSAVSWNVRDTPRWQTSWDVSPASDSPLKLTVPAVGASTPVSTLNSVDLPAPLGPMTARISPRSTLIDTRSTATRAPKWRLRSRHSRYGVATVALAEPSGQAPQALGNEDHHRDENEAEDADQGLDDAGEIVLQEQEEDGGDDRADKRAGATDDDHDEHLSRQDPEEEVGRGEAGERRVEGAGQPTEEHGDDEDDELVRARVVTERLGLALVVTNGQQRRPDRRGDEGTAERVRAGEADRHEVVVAGLRPEPREPERPRRPWHAGQAVGAAGHAVPLVGDGIEQLSEGQCEHRERHAGRARAEPTDGDGDERGDEGGPDHHERQRPSEMQEQQRGRVGAEPVRGGVTERVEPGVADEQIETDGEEAEDHRFGQRGDDKRGERERRRREGDGPDTEQPAPRHSSRPKRPRGRSTSTAIMAR